MGLGRQMFGAASMLGIVTSALVLPAACYAPTEVVLDLSTDLDCVRDGPRTRIWNGVPASIDDLHEAETTERDCAPVDGGRARIGTLVMVPSGDRDSRAAVRVVLAASPFRPDQCSDPVAKPRCIFATRAFSFLPHTSRRLPIHLSADCFGKECVPGETTCFAGACVPVDVVCNDATCDVSADAGSDATVVADASQESDGPVAPACAGPGDGVLATSTEIPPFATATATHLYFATGPVISQISKKDFSRVDKTVETFASQNIEALESDGVSAWVAYEVGATGQKRALVRFEDLGVAELPASVLARVTALLPVPGPKGAQRIFFGQPGQLRARLEVEPTDTLFRPIETASLALATSRLVTRFGTTVRVFSTTSGVEVLIPGQPGDVTALTGNLKRAWLAAAPSAGSPSTAHGIYEIGTTAFLPVHRVPKAPSLLVVDEASFFWPDGGSPTPAILTLPLAPSPDPAVEAKPAVLPLAAPTPAKIGHLSADASPAGCMYYWALRDVGSKAELRIASKK